MSARPVPVSDLTAVAAADEIDQLTEQIRAADDAY
jgi:hypothetical protein